MRAPLWGNSIYHADNDFLSFAWLYRGALIVHGFYHATQAIEKYFKGLALWIIDPNGDTETVRNNRWLLSHDLVDQQTLEARAYAVARHFRPMLVNTAVGFIGPEYLYDGKQIVRAGLEDHFCGKLLGVPMGCDVCYTNHAEADQDDMDVLLTLLGAAGVNYIMGVPGADDVMLNYQSTSFHDALYLRQVLGLRPAPEFEAWLAGDGFSRLALEANHPERLLPA
jgi:hypothetical protein